MVKTTSAGMDTHLAQEVTSLCTCWQITRRDGTQLFFTDHDTDITFQGDTYRAETGFTRSAIQNDSTLSVDNLNLDGLFDSNDITIEDLRAGAYDYAEVRIFMLNWDDLTDLDIKIRRGWLGEVTATEQGIFRAELRGLTQALSQTFGSVYQPECRADLGDTACTVPIDPGTWDGLIGASDRTYRRGAFIKSVTAGAPDGTQADYENRIYELSGGDISGASEPAFNTTVGATTLDGGAQAGIDWNGLTTIINFTNGDTITFTSVTYTFVNVLGSANDVLIGATQADSYNNWIDAVDDNSANEGVTYGTGTVQHPDLESDPSWNGSSFVLPWLTRGVGRDKNSLSYSEVASQGGWDSLGLTGGLDPYSWTTRQAWTRHGVIDTINDQTSFTLTVGFDESRAVDDWFNGGVLRFDDGDNAGVSIEIRDWVQSTRTVTLFFAAPYTLTASTKVALFPGCDKRLATCNTKWAISGSLEFPSGRGNALNFRGEPHVPGPDEATRYPDAKSG